MDNFQYTPFANPYAASIADEIARSGDAHARAAEIVGRASARASLISGSGWAHALDNIGQIPAQVAATQSMQADRKLKEQELGVRVADQQQAQAQRVATLTGRIAGVSDTPEAFGQRLEQAATSGLIPAPIAQHIAGQLQAAGPDGFRALRQNFIDFADQFATPVKLEKDTQLVRPSVGGGAPVVASGQRSPMKLTPGELAVDEQTGQPIASAPFAPGTGNQVVNGQMLDAAGQAVGAPVPKQETASEQAERQAQTLKLTREAAEIDQKLKGTTPISPKDRAELELRRAQIALETSRNDRIERREDVNSPKNQEGLEQHYRDLARAVISSRSGTLGVEDSKVTAAKHLITMFNANTDKDGNINIPPQQYQELATGLATLVNPKGVPSDAATEALKARTLRGDMGAAAQYLTGSNHNGTTQEIAKYLREQVERQGLTAESNREKELDFIRASRPTDLQPERAAGIEKGLAGLNRMADVGVGLERKPGMIYAKDPAGNIHEAKEGTALPAGWVKQ